VTGAAEPGFLETGLSELQSNFSIDTRAPRVAHSRCNRFSGGAELDFMARYECALEDLCTLYTVQPIELDTPSFGIVRRERYRSGAAAA
jgi:hypothetical protein